MKTLRRVGIMTITGMFGLSFYASQVFAASSSSLDILRQGVLGAGTGALSSGMSGGNAGKGALIGAGTSVIGGALLGFLTEPSSSGQQVSYAQPNYVALQPIYQPVYQPEPVYSQPTVTYSQPQSNPNTNILKQGILGAGTGDIAASASGGNAGKGALIGAGTNVIGGALLDTLTGPSASQQPVYYNPAQTSTVPVLANSTQVNQVPQKHIVRKFNSDGKVISEEEFWQ